MAVDVSSLTPEQLSEYKSKRTAYFRGTIAVACIYGTLALVMFLIAVFSPTGRTIITDTMLPFTIAFVGGMIIVVMFLLIAIFSTEAPPKTVFSYDNGKCPDYWTLEKTPPGMLNSYDGAQRAQLAYRCVKDPQAPTNRLKPIGGIKAGTDLDTLMAVTQWPYQTQYTAPTRTTNGNGNINCDVVYPDFMDFQDMQYKGNSAMSPNRLRCEYAKQCGLSWSASCPNK